MRHAARLSLVVMGAWLALPGGSAWYAALPGAALLMLLAFEEEARRAELPVRALAFSAGLVLLVLAIGSPAAWGAGVASLAVLTIPALAATAKGARSSVPAFALVAFAVGVALPVVLGVVLHVVGLAEGGSTLRAAVPRAAGVALPLALAASCVVVGLLRTSSALGVVLAAGAALLIALRFHYVLGLARLDSELFWPEAPMLVNALKLEAGDLLYGPRDALTSYSYAPLLDVTHRVLLRPFGLHLELFAHRALVLADQALAAAVLLYALSPALGRLVPSLRASAVLLVAFACFSNLLGPAVHPDHPLLLCFAVAMLLVIAGDRLPPRVRDVLLVLVTPVAVSFKLSGAGIGVALVALALASRRRRDLVLLGASAALSVATVPLFDALFGSYSFYAITLQRSHPLELAHLTNPEWRAYGILTLVIPVIVALTRRFVGRGEGAGAVQGAGAVTSALVLTLVMGLASLPAAAKYAGRENNAAILFVGLVVVLVLVGAHTRKGAVAVLATATWGALATCPPRLPPGREARAEIAADTALMADAIRRDAAIGETSLLLTSVLPWIRAGRTDVPADRWHSAIELWFGGYPEGALLAARIRAGTYRTVIASGGELRPLGGPARGFQEGVAEALVARYEADPTPRARARVYVRRAP